MGHTSPSNQALAAAHFMPGTMTTDVLCVANTSRSDLVCWTDLECLVVDRGTRAHWVFERPEFLDGYALTALALSGLSLLVALSAIAFVVHHRKTPVMRISQFPFMLLLAIGFFLVDLAVLLQVIGLLGYFPNLCRAYFLLFYFSVTAIFNSLSLKTYRAWKLLRSTQKLQRMEISNTFLFTCLGVSEIIIVIILAAWFIIYPLDVNPCEDVGAECSILTTSDGSLFSGNGAFINAILMIILLSVFGITMAVATAAKRVPSIASESYGIFVSVLLFWVGMLIVCVFFYLSGIFENASTVKSCVVAAYFFLTTVVSLYMLIFVKRKYTHLSADEIRSIFLSAASSAGSVSKKSTAAKHSLSSTGAVSTSAESTSSAKHSVPTATPWFGRPQDDLEGDGDQVARAISRV